MDPIKDLHEATNIALENQNALGFAMPPFIPFKDTVTVKKSADIDGSAELKTRLASGLVENTNWICPVTFKLAGQADYDFPVDPKLSMSSKNIITRRYVNKSKSRGSIKEHWSQDDWEINISGVIIEPDAKFMKNQLLWLRQYLDSAKSIDITCAVLNQMDVFRISIESYEFPFTKGVENQAFVIKAYSDGDYELLIKN